MDEKIILLIEDNEDDIALTLRAFRKNNINSKVVVLKDGAEAMSWLENNIVNIDSNETILPGLILLDLKLPKISGLEVLKSIKNNESLKTIPVVVLTTSQEEQDLINCYQNHANSYIRKPVDYVNFVELVNKVGYYWLNLNESIPVKANYG